MIVVIKSEATRPEIEKLAALLEQMGVEVHYSQGTNKTVLGLVGDTTGIDPETIQANHLVEKVIRIQEPYRRVNRLFHPEDTCVTVKAPNGNECSIGGAALGIIAGPCSVETREQIISIAREVKKAGAGFLRGGIFKPRSSPYSFQGLGSEGLDMLLEAKRETGLPIVTEIIDIHQLDTFGEVDIVQVGTRNMHNYVLLKELGKCKKPILLKRGYASTITELLMAAEYILTGGNDQIILCERGIRTFDDYTRFTLDLSAVPALKKQSHLPVIVDPSHAAGISWMVPSLAKASIAAGADGLILEVHNNPEKALCDGDQSITSVEFASLISALRKYAELEGRKL